MMSRFASAAIVEASKRVPLGGDRVAFRRDGVALGFGRAPRLELPLRLLVLLLHDRELRPRGLELGLDQPSDLFANGDAGPELGLGPRRLFLGGADPRVDLTDGGLLGGECFLGLGELGGHALELAPQVRLVRL